MPFGQADRKGGILLLSKIRFDENEQDERLMSAAEILNNDSFERLKEKTIRKKIGEIVFIVLAVIVLCGILACGYAYMFFKVKTIEVRGNKLYASEDIISTSGITEKDNLFAVKEADLQDKLSLKFPYIKSVSVTRVFPSTLVVTVTEDSPCYYTEIGGEYYLLSETLRVLERAASAQEFTERMDGLLPLSLPAATYVVTGREVAFARESTYDYMMSFLAQLRASPLFPQISSIHASDKFSMYIILCDHRYKALLGSNDDMEAKLSFLSAIIEAKFDETTIALININKVESAFVTYSKNLFED